MTQRTHRSEEDLLRLADEILQGDHPQAVRPDAGASPARDLLDASAVEGWLFASLLEDEYFPRQAEREVELHTRFAKNGLRVEERVGSGGMGVIYRALDENLQRVVAVKTISPSVAWRQEDRTRFRREALLLSQLDHPNICQVFRLIEGETNETADLLVLEFVRGRTLAEVDLGELSQTQRLRIAHQIAAALASAHQRGVVHRDLKPANIMLREDGVVKVLDFGIARSFDAAQAPSTPSAGKVAADLAGDGNLTQTAALLGTPAFMSPEQLRGEIAGPAADLWALGLLLHQLFALGPVWRPEVDLLEQVARGQPLPAQGGDADVMSLVEELKQLDPGARPAATEVAQRFEALMERPARLRRRRQIVGLAAIALLAVTLAVALPLRERQRSAQRVQQAQRVGEELRSIEHDLRVEALLPLHSIEPAKLQLRQRLDDILVELRLQNTDPALTAYALGRGELALGNPRGAREQLLAAWELGLREPQLAAALGRAHAQLFDIALEESERVADPGLRAAEVARAQAELRDVALEWLQRAGEASDPLAEAELLQLRGAPTAVLQLLTEAEIAPAERGKALLLRGRARRSLAVQALANSMEESIAELERARSEFESGLQVARSSPQLWAALCQVEIDLFEAARDRGRGAASAAARHAQYGRTVEACERARTVDPGVFENTRRLSRSHRLAAFDLTMSNLDAAGEAMSRAAAAVEWARPRFEGQVRFDLERLEHLARSTELAQAIGQPMQDELRELVALGESVLERLPANAEALISVGFGQWTLAFDLFVAGEDSRQGFELAIETLSRAVELAPNSSNLHNMIGTAQGMSGLSMLERGDDPTPRLAECVASFERAIELYPDNPFPRANLGMAYRDLADYAVLLGQDPAPHLGPGYKTLQTARALREDYADTWLTQAELDLAEARFALEGLDASRASSAFARAEAAVRKALDLNPSVYAGNLRLAQALLGRVQAAELPRQSTGPAEADHSEKWLAEAERRLAEQVSAGLASERTYAAFAALWRLRAERAERAARDGLLAQAQGHLERAGEAGRGEFYLEAARVARARAHGSRPPERNQFERQAREALDRAVLLNANLQRLAELMQGELRQLGERSERTQR